VIVERGFTPREMGRQTPETALMNAEIFNVLHRAALVVVDLTAMRTNCLMELGYALGRRRRFVISAQDGASRLRPRQAADLLLGRRRHRPRTASRLSRVARPVLGPAADCRLKRRAVRPTQWHGRSRASSSLTKTEERRRCENRGH
jgi:hypothetical protein